MSVSAPASAIPLRQLDIRQRINSTEDTDLRFDVRRDLERSTLSAVQVGVRFAKTEYERRQGVLSSPATAALTFADGRGPFVVDGSFAEGFGGAGVLRAWPSVDPEALYNSNPAPGPFIFNDGNAFLIKERTNALYGMINFDQPVGVFYTRGNVGVRVVETEYTGDGRVSITNQNSVLLPFVDDAPDLKRDYTNILPSANVVISKGENADFQVRAAISRAMSRPNINQISPVITINLEDIVDPAVDTGLISRGNPALDPFEAWQYDLGFEYYFGEEKEGFLSLNYFHKDVENFFFPVTESLTAAFPEFGINDMFTYQVRTFASGGEAEIQGFELSLQAPFIFLPGFWSDFGSVINYTYTDSESTINGITQDFPGASENSYNMIAYYERDGLSTRLAYNYRDEFLINPSNEPLGTNAVFGDAQGRLDFAVRYRFDNGVRLSFDAQNLMEEQSYRFYDTPQKLRELDVEGAIYSVGVGYIF